MIKFSAPLCAVLAAVAFISCENIIPDDVSGISLKTVDAAVDYTSAQVFGKIRISQKPERISEVRVYYGTASNDLSKNAKAVIDSDYSFSADIPSLEDGVQFFYRVDIIVGRTPIEGPVQDFITFPKGPIDLDLPSGYKWASHNVGASIPTETGGYYSWAEITEKKEYDWTTYKYCRDSQYLLTKYSVVVGYTEGEPDNQVDLLPEDDVAASLFGEHYSVPTYKDWKELMDNCVIEKATINGCLGCKVSSRKDRANNKKFIFLPGENGYFSGTSIIKSNSYYWTSTIDSKINSSALNIRVGSDMGNSTGNRSFGESVRAIYK